MLTPQDLAAKLVQEEDIATAISVYKEAQKSIKAYDAVRSQARNLVKDHIEQSGETKGQTAYGTFGLTKPTRKFELNQEKWRLACQEDPALASIEDRFLTARRALDEAQRAFLEDITPEPNIYIR